MAQKILVDDQIDDGQKIIDQFRADGLDVTVAFWVKPDGRSWSLYIASPGFDEKEPVEAYRAFHDSVSRIPDLTILPWVDIRMIGDEDPITRDALKIVSRKGKKDGIRYRGTRLVDLGIVRAYIYPKPEPPARQAFIVTYKRTAHTNQWSAMTRRAEYSRTLGSKGAVSYSTAQWLGDEPGKENFAHVYVLVEVAPSLDERALATNPEILHRLADQARRTADEMFESKHPGASIEHESVVMNLE